MGGAILRNVSRWRNLPILVALAAALGCSQNMPATGNLQASHSAFHGGSEANLTFVRPEREGPMVEVREDDSPDYRGWIVSLAIRNFGHEKSMPDVEVQVEVDGRVAADWLIAQPIDADQVLANPALRIGQLPPGEHALRVVIDPSNRIPETMKTDNEFRTSFTVPPKP